MGASPDCCCWLSDVQWHCADQTDCFLRSAAGPRKWMCLLPACRSWRPRPPWHGQTCASGCWAAPRRSGPCCLSSRCWSAPSSWWAETSAQSWTRSPDCWAPRWRRPSACRPLRPAPFRPAAGQIWLCSSRPPPMQHLRALLVAASAAAWRGRRAAQRRQRPRCHRAGCRERSMLCGGLMSSSARPWWRRWMPAEAVGSSLSRPRRAAAARHGGQPV